MCCSFPLARRSQLAVLQVVVITSLHSRRRHGTWKDVCPSLLSSTQGLLPHLSFFFPVLPVSKLPLSLVCLAQMSITVSLPSRCIVDQPSTFKLTYHLLPSLPVSHRRPKLDHHQSVVLLPMVDTSECMIDREPYLQTGFESWRNGVRLAQPSSVQCSSADLTLIMLQFPTSESSRITARKRVETSSRATSSSTPIVEGRSTSKRIFFPYTLSFRGLELCPI